MSGPGENLHLVVFDTQHSCEILNAGSFIFPYSLNDNYDFFLHASFKCWLVIEKTTKKTEMNEKINKSSYKACDKNNILCNEKKL